jgi:hypothetical protein
MSMLLNSVQVQVDKAEKDPTSAKKSNVLDPSSSS